MPHQSYEFDHVGRWDRVPPKDQRKILELCHASKGKKVWLDTDFFAKHNVTIPKKLFISLEMRMAVKVRRCSPQQ